MCRITGKIVPALLAVFEGVKGARSRSDAATAYPRPSGLRPSPRIRSSAIRRPRPDFSYPSANTKAAKISHTVVLPKPDSAQRADSAGEASTSLSAAASETAIKPVAAAGIGSRTSAVTVPANTAKNRHAESVSPAGVGSSASAIATSGGTAALERRIRILRTS